MNTSTQTSRTLPAAHSTIEARRHGSRGLAALTVLVAAGCSTPKVSETAAALDQTVLGLAQSFAVLGGTTVTNTGSSTIYGDLGVNPGLSVTGFPPGLVSGGTIHAGDAVTLNAQNDVTTAYVTLAGTAPTLDLTGQDLGGMTLTPGVYHFATSAQLTGALTLNALGDPNAVFVFQIGSTLTTAVNSSVLIINGVNDCNIFWQVGSSATLGTTTAFKGNILALTSITLNTGAKVSGRTLARNAAVTLDTNDVSTLACTMPDSTGPDAGVGPAVDAGAGAADGACVTVDAPPADAPCNAVDAAPADAACPNTPI